MKQLSTELVVLERFWRVCAGVKCLVLEFVRIPHGSGRGNCPSLLLAFWMVHLMSVACALTCLCQAIEERAQDMSM